GGGGNYFVLNLKE
ncbi:hypothetical protein BV203_00218B, partial [Haemophilus influenzae]